MISSETVNPDPVRPCICEGEHDRSRVSRSVPLRLSNQHSLAHSLPHSPSPSLSLSLVLGIIVCCLWFRGYGFTFMTYLERFLVEGSRSVYCCSHEAGLTAFMRRARQRTSFVWRDEEQYAPQSPYTCHIFRAKRQTQSAWQVRGESMVEVIRKCAAKPETRNHKS